MKASRGDLHDLLTPHTHLLMTRPTLGNRKVLRIEVCVKGLGNNGG